MATTTLGTAYIEILGRTDKFGASVEKGVKAQTAKIGKDHAIPVTGRTDKFGSSVEPGILSSMKGIALKAAGTFAAAFVINKSVNFAKDAVGFASDLNESIGKVDVVFGKNADTIKRWADGANKSLGSTRQQALEAAGTFGNLFIAFGLGRDEATGMSKKLVELATDLASFNNSSVDDALLALRSGLSGETEPLKRFGVALSDDRLKLQALKLGLIATTKQALTPAIKAQASYNLILQDTKLAQGDFARTSGGLANQQRILSATVKDLKTQFGSFLLPVVLKVTKGLASGLPKAFDSARAAAKKLEPIVKFVGLSFGAFFASIREGDVTSDGFIGFVETVGEAIHNLALAIAGFVETGVSNILAGFRGLPGDGGPAASFFHFVGEAARNLSDFITGPKGIKIIEGVREKFGDLVDFGKDTVRFFKENETAASALQIVIGALAASVATLVIGAKALTGLNLLRASLQGITELLPALIGAGPFALLAAAIVAVGVAGFIAYKRFKPFHDLMDSIGKFVARNINVLAGLAGVVAALAAAFGPLLLGVTVANPIILIGVAIVGIGVAAFAAYKKFKPFRDLVDSIGRGIGKAAVATFKAIQTAISATADFLGPVIGRIREVVGSIVETLGPVFVQIGSTIGRVLGPVLSAVVGALSDLFGFIIRNAPVAFGFLQDGIAFAADVIGEIVSIAQTVAGALAVAFRAVVGFVSRVVDAIEGSAVFAFIVEQAEHFVAFLVEIAPQVREAIGHIVAVIAVVLRGVGEAFQSGFAVASFVIGVVVDQIRLLARVVGAAVDVISALWRQFGDEILSIIGFALQPLVFAVKAVLGGVADAFRVVVSVVMFLWRKWGDDLLKILKGFLSPIVAAVKFVVNTIANVIRLVLAIINGDWGKAWDAVKSIVKGAIDFVLGVLGGVLDIITGLLGGIADTVSGIWHNAWDGLSGIVSAVFDAVVGFVTGLPGRIVSAASSLIDTIRGLFGDAWEGLKTIASESLNAIVGFVLGLPARISGLAHTVFDAFKDLGGQIIGGILDGLKAAGGFVTDFAKSIANGLIDVVNEQIIARINGALEFSIDPPGPGPKISFNPPDIPPIPRLAGGGVAKRNNPITAIIGDNPTRDELVAPVPPGFFRAMEKIAAGRSTDGRPLTGPVTIVESPDGRKTYSDFVRAVRASQFLVGAN